jgi:hypothetical protein
LAAVVEIRWQTLYAGQGIADCGYERGFSQYRGELRGQPSLQIIIGRGGFPCGPARLSGD